MTEALEPELRFSQRPAGAFVGVGVGAGAACAAAGASRLSIPTAAPDMNPRASPSAAPAGIASLHALEAAAFAAWPAIEEEHVHGWRLRFAQGYTKRANSANATASSEALRAVDIDEIERRYAARGLPPIFRLVSFSPAANALDAALEARGYAWVDASEVWVAALAGGDAATAGVPELVADAADWLGVFQAVSGQHGDDQAIHLAMLESIAAEKAFAVERDGSPACCGLGVRDDAHVGLFDIVTRADRRGQGRAARLCAGLLAWGHARGATTAYLQVLATNTPAIRLYERLGFRRAYGYGYRVKG
jgi:ribosomal protein S18 acetylase RimI-like enzyme